MGSNSRAVKARQRKYRIERRREMREHFKRRAASRPSQQPGPGGGTASAEPAPPAAPG